MPRLVGLLCLLAVVGLYSAVPRWRAGWRPVALFGEPFDSNLPVQWDSSAEGALGPDFDGLRRYYSAASAHLRSAAPRAHAALRAPARAREQQLALVSAAQPRGPARLQSLCCCWRQRLWSMSRRRCGFRKALFHFHAL